MLEQPAIAEGDLVCPMCGGRRTEDDVRDQRCCLDCRTGKGTLELLDGDFRTGSPHVNSFPDLPAIKHFACKLFSVATFDVNVLDRLEDWLQAEHHKSREQMLAMQVSQVAAMLRAACEPTPPTESKMPVAHRAEEAFGISTDVEDRPLVNSTGDSFTNSPGQGQTEEASASSLSSPQPGEPQEKKERQELQPFCGGAMVFFRDRVEFCGVHIGSGSRSQTRRRILDLLRKKRSNGSFVGYSSEQLAEDAELKGGQGAAAGAIRDLRNDIVELLRNQASLKCGRNDVILSGGRGYRFADCVRTPIVIVMTAHGTDGPELAVDVMKKGAVDYVTKSFTSVGRTLDKSIREAVAGLGEDFSPAPHVATAVRSRNTEAEQASQPKVFSGGKMVFYADYVHGPDVLNNKNKMRRRTSG